MDQEVSLGINIQQGNIQIEESVFIAMCVRYAIEKGITEQIGTYGVEVLERAADRLFLHPLK